MRQKLYFYAQLVLLLAGTPAFAATYFVSATGNDAQAGTSAATAWRTVDRVNITPLQAGDQVLFEAAQVFAGSLYVASAGTRAQPIVFGSYGDGAAATISSGLATGFFAYNVGGIELRRLAFVGAGRQTNTNAGVVFHLSGINAAVDHLVLDQVDISGYQSYGLDVESYFGSGGYTNVRITRSAMHDNGNSGLFVYGEQAQPHRSWYIADCKLDRNTGRPDITNFNTGSGIVLGGVAGGLIERCEAYDNGMLSANPFSGPAGIWAYNSRDLVVQFCEAHHNRSGTLDGGGFDIDGGCTNMTLQYNYSHDNEGPGYLISQYGGAALLSKATIRYNISENDSRKYGGAITIWCFDNTNVGIDGVAIHNNTVYLTPTSTGFIPRAVYIMSDGIANASLRNNILQTTGGVPLIVSLGTRGVTLQGNSYWTTGGPIDIQWGGAYYNSLNSWQSAVNQELVDGQNAAINEDPKLVAPGMGGMQSTAMAPSGRTAWTPYQLQATSPLWGRGLNLNSRFGMNPGPHDFFGLPTPAAGSPANVGAFEGGNAAAPLPVTLVSFGASRLPDNQVLLRWATATETNSATFDIERSADGKRFELVGQVAAAGHSSSARAYAWQDRAAPAALAYYRLRLVDADASAAYSSVAVVPAAAGGAAVRLSVYPNPVRSGQSPRLVLPAGTADGAQLSLTTMLGQRLLNRPLTRTEASTGSLTLPNGLPAGVYVVGVSGAGLGTHYTRLLVER